MAGMIREREGGKEREDPRPRCPGCPRPGSSRRHSRPRPSDHPWAPGMQESGGGVGWGGAGGLWEAVAGLMLLLPEGLPRARPRPRRRAHGDRDGHLLPRPALRQPGWGPPHPTTTTTPPMGSAARALPPSPAPPCFPRCPGPRSAPPGAAPPGTGASARDGGQEGVSQGRSVPRPREGCEPAWASHVRPASQAKAPPPAPPPP